jgi:hypothetical protein
MKTLERDGIEGITIAVCPAGGAARPFASGYVHSCHRLSGLNLTNTACGNWRLLDARYRTSHTSAGFIQTTALPAPEHGAVSRRRCRMKAPHRQHLVPRHGNTPHVAEALRLFFSVAATASLAATSGLLKSGWQMADLCHDDGDDGVPAAFATAASAHLHQAGVAGAGR